MLLKSGNKHITINRIYSKIFSVLGELGGFRDILIVFMTIFYLIVNCSRDVTQIKRRILGKNYLGNRELFENEANLVVVGKNGKRNRKNRTVDMENEVINQAIDGIMLSQKALEVNVMNGLILKDHHRTLLPIVYMYQAQKRLEEEKVKNLAVGLLKISIKDKNVLNNIF